MRGVFEIFVLHLLRVWTGPHAYLWYYEILLKQNFGRDFVVIHTYQQVLGRKDWYIGRVIFYTSIWQSYILHINMAELYSTHQYGRVIFYTSIWQSYILHINMAELYSTHQYGRVIFYTSIWQSYILHINMAELYSTHQYGRVIFYTSIWQSYILHINMAELYSTHQYAELYSTHQYGRVIFYTSIWQSYILLYKYGLGLSSIWKNMARLRHIILTEAEGRGQYNMS